MAKRAAFAHRRGGTSAHRHTTHHDRTIGRSAAHAHVLSRADLERVRRLAEVVFDDNAHFAARDAAERAERARRLAAEQRAAEEHERSRRENDRE